MDVEAGIGLAHRRLSILDLSVAGAQPMTSADGRFVISFNGEIYNHSVLRQELEAAAGPLSWRGHSDTETLLAAIQSWGLRQTLRRSFGMFALALWDREDATLSLARDRTGEKPLYLAAVGSAWAFASEPQAFRHIPGFDPRRDPAALAAYLATSAVPDRMCVFARVGKVRPGTVLQIRPADGSVVEREYETVLQLIKRAQSARLEAGDAADEVQAVLRDVVASQMMSDVPLGSFLSGGVDSSLVTALMQEVADRPVRTFSIGFSDAGYDESVHAERVATHLGTEHTTYRLTEEDALAIVPRLARIYGEPFADSSQIPTALLCACARREVTVALTGDGGDEVFGGYTRHFLGPRLWARLSAVPKPLRKAAPLLGRAVRRLGGGQSRMLRGLIKCAGLPATLLDKAERMGEVAAHASSLESVYASLTRSLDAPEAYLLEPPRGPGGPAATVDLEWLTLEPEERMMAMDTLGYLPSDILVKVDRASMNVSLETRAPFLDARTIEVAWRLPLEARIRDGKGKQVLREILDRYIPRDLIERPKQGFAVPIDRWLRGELRSWADGFLTRDAIVAAGIFCDEPVRDLWAAHLAQRGNFGQTLWTILMFQAWQLEWMESNTAAMEIAAAE